MCFEHCLQHMLRLTYQANKSSKSATVKTSTDLRIESHTSQSQQHNKQVNQANQPSKSRQATKSKASKQARMSTSNASSQPGRATTHAKKPPTPKGRAKKNVTNERKLMELAYERNQKRIEELEQVVCKLSQQLMETPPSRPSSQSRPSAKAKQTQARAPVVTAASPPPPEARATWFGDAF